MHYKEPIKVNLVKHKKHYKVIADPVQAKENDKVNVFKNRKDLKRSHSVTTKVSELQLVSVVEKPPHSNSATDEPKRYCLSGISGY